MMRNHWGRLVWWKGKASLQEASYYMTQSERLMLSNEVIGVSELETEENEDWKLKMWEWK